MSKKVAKSTLDGVDAVTTKWTHLLFGGDTNHDEEEEDGDGDGRGAEDGDQEKGQEEAKEKDGISKDQRGETPVFVRKFHGLYQLVCYVVFKLIYLTFSYYFLMYVFSTEYRYLDSTQQTISKLHQIVIS